MAAKRGSEGGERLPARRSQAIGLGYVLPSVLDEESNAGSVNGSDLRSAFVPITDSIVLNRRYSLAFAREGGRLDTLLLQNVSCRE